MLQTMLQEAHEAFSRNAFWHPVKCALPCGWTASATSLISLYVDDNLLTLLLVFTKRASMACG